jgi:hypothetical protein
VNKTTTGTIDQHLTNDTNVPLKEHNSGYLLIVLDAPELLPALDDMTGDIVTEFLNHGS